MITGVYSIRNVKNGKRYIGSAASQRDGIRGRWTRHIRELNNKQHHSSKLQNAWNKYGADVFVFEVLLYCDQQDCLTFEQMAIDCYKPEYNICFVAGNCLGVTRSQQTKRLLSNLHSGKNNPMHGKTHNQAIKERIGKLTLKQVEAIKNQLAIGLSQRVIAGKFGISQATVSRINTGHIWN